MRVNTTGSSFEYYGTFYVSSDIGIDAIGNPILLTLSLVSVIVLMRKGRHRNLVYIFLMQLSVLLIGFLWQPWISRFSLPLLALGSILIGLALSHLKYRPLVKVSLNIIIVITVIYGSFWHLYQPGKSILNPAPLYSIASELGIDTSSARGLRHDLKLPRSQQYFAFNQKVEESYLGAIETINKNDFRKIYLVNTGDDLEFPIWTLTYYKVPIVHANNDDFIIESTKISPQDVIFCTTRCTDSNLIKIYDSEYAKLYQVKK